MANISKKYGKWYVQIRRTFHKPIYKSFIAKQDAQRWARETERLIETGQFVDMSEANKTTLKHLLEVIRVKLNPTQLIQTVELQKIKKKFQFPKRKPR